MKNSSGKLCWNTSGASKCEDRSCTNAPSTAITKQLCNNHVEDGTN